MNVVHSKILIKQSTCLTPVVINIATDWNLVLSQNFNPLPEYLGVNEKVGMASPRIYTTQPKFFLYLTMEGQTYKHTNIPARSDVIAPTVGIKREVKAA